MQVKKFNPETGKDEWADQGEAVIKGRGDLTSRHTYMSRKFPGSQENRAWGATKNRFFTKSQRALMTAIQNKTVIANGCIKCGRSIKTTSWNYQKLRRLPHICYKCRQVGY